MKTSYIIIILGTLFLLVSAYYYWQNSAGPLPIVPLVHTLIFISGVYSASRIYKSYLANKINAIKYLSFGIFPHAFCGFVMGASALLLWNNPFLFGLIGFDIAMSVHMIGIGYFARIPFELKGLTKLSKFSFLGVIVLGEVIMLLNFIYMPGPFIHESGVTMWNLQPPLDLAFLASFMIIVVWVGLFFLYEGLRASDSFVRTRSLLFALGVILIGLGEGTLFFTHSTVIGALAALSVAVAFLAFLAGVLYQKKPSEAVAPAISS